MWLALGVGLPNLIVSSEIPGPSVGLAAYGFLVLPDGDAVNPLRHMARVIGADSRPA